MVAVLGRRHLGGGYEGAVQLILGGCHYHAQSKWCVGSACGASILRAVRRGSLLRVLQLAVVFSFGLVRVGP